MTKKKLVLVVEINSKCVKSQPQPTPTVPVVLNQLTNLTHLITSGCKAQALEIFDSSTFFVFLSPLRAGQHWAAVTMPRPVLLPRSFLALQSGFPCLCQCHSSLHFACGYCSIACLGHLEVIWRWIQQVFILSTIYIWLPKMKCMHKCTVNTHSHSVPVLTEVLEFALEPVYLQYSSKPQQKWTRWPSKRIKLKTKGNTVTVEGSVYASSSFSVNHFWVKLKLHLLTGHHIQIRGQRKQYWGTCFSFCSLEQCIIHRSMNATHVFFSLECMIMNWQLFSWISFHLRPEWCCEVL